MNRLITDTLISNKLSAALDILGYSLQSIAIKQCLAKLHQKHRNRLMEKYLNTHIYIVGSTMEGVSDDTSDTDYLYVDSSTRYSTTPNHDSLSMFMDSSPPGYALLEVLNKPDSGAECYHRHNGNMFLASSIVFHGALDADVVGPFRKQAQGDEMDIINLELNFFRGFAPTIKSSGPSTEFRVGNMSSDNVHAFPAVVRKLSEEWRKRKRYHSFPSDFQTRELSKLDGQVVPIGCKSSEDVNFQWRVCFTFAEVALIQSFNATQFKVYGILKMLSKSVFKQVCPGVTSYAIKNMVLWVSELNPLSLFQENNIPQCLVVCLHFLRLCVKNRHLPSYMIPDRDLLYGKLKGNTARELDQLLGEMITERGLMVLRCEKLKYSFQLVLKVPKYLTYVDISSQAVSYVLDRVAYMDIDVSTFINDNILGFIGKYIDAIEMCFPLVCLSAKYDMLHSLIRWWGTACYFETNPDAYPHEVADKARLLRRCKQLSARIKESMISDFEHIVKQLLMAYLIQSALFYGDEAGEYLLLGILIANGLFEIGTVRNIITRCVTIWCDGDMPTTAKEEYEMVCKSFEQLDTVVKMCTDMLRSL